MRKKLLKDLLPSGVSLEEKSGQSGLIVSAPGKGRVHIKVHQSYWDSDEWYIGQLARHITATMGLDTPVYRRQAR